MGNCGFDGDWSLRPDLEQALVSRQNKGRSAGHDPLGGPVVAGATDPIRACRDTRRITGRVGRALGLHLARDIGLLLLRQSDRQGRDHQAATENHQDQTAIFHG